MKFARSVTCSYSIAAAVTTRELAMTRQRRRKRHPLAVPLTALFVLVGIPSSLAEEQPSPGARAASAGPSETGRSRYAPYWYIDDNTDSLLEVKSHVGKSPMALLPTVVMLDGKQQRLN